MASEDFEYIAWVIQTICMVLLQCFLELEGDLAWLNFHFWVKYYFKLHWNKPELCSDFWAFGASENVRDVEVILWTGLPLILEHCSSRLTCQCGLSAKAARIKLPVPSKTVSWCFSGCHMLAFGSDFGLFLKPGPLELMITVALVAETVMQ